MVVQLLRTNRSGDRAECDTLRSVCLRRRDVCRRTSLIRSRREYEMYRLAHRKQPEAGRALVDGRVGSRLRAE